MGGKLLDERRNAVGMTCPRCDGETWVCENHPDRPFYGRRACDCGSAGMPCICNPMSKDWQVEKTAMGLAGGEMWGALSGVERDRLRLAAKKMLGTTAARSAEAQNR